MSKNIAILLSVLLMLSCSSNPPRKIYTGDTTKKKTASYQIQEEGKTIGYAHKYEWENLDGDERHHYFIFDVRGDLVGYVGGNGLARKFLPNQTTQELGHFTLEQASSKIFDAQREIFVFPVTAQDVATKPLSIEVSSSKEKKEETEKEAPKTKEEDIEEAKRPDESETEDHSEW